MDEVDGNPTNDESIYKSKLISFFNCFQSKIRCLTLLLFIILMTLYLVKMLTERLDPIVMENLLNNSVSYVLNHLQKM